MSFIAFIDKFIPFIDEFPLLVAIKISTHYQNHKGARNGPLSGKPARKMMGSVVQRSEGLPTDHIKDAASVKGLPPAYENISIIVAIAHSPH